MQYKRQLNPNSLLAQIFSNTPKNETREKKSRLKELPIKSNALRLKRDYYILCEVSVYIYTRRSFARKVYKYSSSVRRSPAD